MGKGEAYEGELGGKEASIVERAYQQQLYNSK